MRDPLRILGRVVGARPGEGLAVGALFLLFFLIRLAFLYLQNFTEATFLTRYGVESLPKVLFASALLTGIFLSVVSRVIDRFDRTGFLALAMVIAAALCLAFRVTIGLEITASYPILYVLSVWVDHVFLISFWLLAGEIFDAREAKRLFPMLAAGGILGAIAANFSTATLSREMGLDNLLVLAAALLGAGAVFLILYSRRLTRERGKRLQRRTARYPKGMIGMLKRSSLLRLLVLIALAPALLVPIVDYLFMFLVDRAYTDEQNLISFWGTFKGSFSLVQFILQLFLAGRLFSGLGLARIFYLLPGNAVLFFSGLVAWFGLPFGLYGKITTQVLDESVNDPARKTLLAFFPDEVRGRVSMFVKGVATRFGHFAGSGLLMALVPWLEGRWLALAGALLAAAGVVAVWFFRRSYDDLVAGAIANRQLDLEGLGTADLARLLKPETEEELLQQLEIGDPPTMRFAAELLLLSGRSDLRDRMEAVLKGLPAERRVEALEALADLPDAPIEALLSAMPDDDDSPLSALFLETRVRAEPDAASKALLRALDGDDPRLLAVALKVGVEHGNDEVRERIGERLPELLGGDDARLLGPALSAAGRLGRDLDSILPWLGDPRPRIRRGAEEAIVHLGPTAVERFEEVMEGAPPRLVLGLVDVLAGYQLPGVPRDRLLGRFLAEARRLRADLLAVSPRTDAEALVAQALAERLDVLRRILIGLVCLEEGVERARVLRRAALDGGRKEAALALEGIEALTPRRFRREMINVFEGRRALPNPRSLAEAARDLETDGDPIEREVAGFLRQGEAMKSDLLEKMTFLRKVPVFESLSIPELSAIARITTERSLKAGSAVFREGDPGDSAWLVLEGTVGISRRSGTQQLAMMKAGDIFGEMALFEKKPRSADVEAMTEVRLLRINGWDFEEIMHEYPDIPIKLCAVLSARLRQTTARV